MDKAKGTPDVIRSVAAAVGSPDESITTIRGTARVWGVADRNGNILLAGSCGMLPFTVPLLAYHDDWQPIGQAVMTPTASGLDYVATFVTGVERVDDIRACIRDGAIPAVSIGWIDERGTSSWNDDWTEHTFPDATVLELSVVAIPAQPEVTLNAASFGGRVDTADLVQIYKAVGKRNSHADAAKIQEIHDAAYALGAECASMDGGNDEDEPTASSKAPRFTAAAGDSTMQLLQQVDAAIDEARDHLAAGNVDQATALLGAADTACDALMAALGIPDPDSGETAAVDLGDAQALLEVLHAQAIALEL